MIVYVEKGIGMHEYVQSKGYELYEQDGVWMSSDDEAVQDIIDSYKEGDYVSQSEADRESAWRADEIAVARGNLDAILFEDPSALPGSERDWKAYGVKLRNWVEGAPGYPLIVNRPARPQ